MKENEIRFMVYMEQHILPNRKNVSYETIREAASMVNIPISGGNCRSCIAKGGVDLLNLYGRLKDSYNEYKNTKIHEAEKVKEENEIVLNEIALNEIVLPSILDELSESIDTQDVGSYNKLDDPLSSLSDTYVKEEDIYPILSKKNRKKK